MNFFSACKSILLTEDIKLKCDSLKLLYFNFNTYNFMPHSLIVSIEKPGRPVKPILVEPQQVIRRKVGNEKGYAGLFHALAHIEYNAINLSLDTCYRFQHMPQQYYLNWLTVAVEEVCHFELLNYYLHQLGYSYGDFTAHNELWVMAYKTEYDILARIGLVHKVLEAKGIDSAPALLHKIPKTNLIAHKILNIIYLDEIKHAQFGNYWFNYICQQRKIDATTTFFELLHQFAIPKITGSIDFAGRIKAGFSHKEIEYLQANKD
ncbi:MAG: hypothetical protein RL017_586 [Pseudomonadota bacterium]|nr:ferritin-like domain-containing protein [Burkholderiales bacterium]